MDALLSRLGEDDRHSRIDVVSRKEIDERAFPRWRMKRIKPDATLLSSPDGSALIETIPSHLKRAVTGFLAASIATGARV